MKLCDLSSLMQHNNNKSLDFTLKGLLKGHIGMLIAAPNVGKSHLALCIAIEHASSTPLLGFSAKSKPQKTLVMSTEDSIDIVQSRMADKLKSCSSKTKKELNENLHFLTDIEPIVSPPSNLPSEQARQKAYIDKLINIFSTFSLVIIDTVTEAIGECDEVNHDRHIKNVIQKIARESGASILLVHHVNKEEIRGNQPISVASGAGLTSIMRLTKCMFSLKQSKKGLIITFLKSNYFAENEKKEFIIDIRNSLTVNPDLAIEEVKVKVKKYILEEPQNITLPGVNVKNEEKETKSLRDVL